MPSLRIQPLHRLRPGAGSRRHWSRAALVAFVLLVLGVPVWQGRALAQNAPDSASVAEAAGSGPLETSIEVQKLEVSEGPGGQEIRRWIPADRLNAGDEIHYTVRVSNPGKQAGGHHRRDQAPAVRRALPARLRHGTRRPKCSFRPTAARRLRRRKRLRAPRAAARRASASRSRTTTRTCAGCSAIRWVPASTALLRFRATFS